jgi:hypothetical protein
MTCSEAEVLVYKRDEYLFFIHQLVDIFIPSFGE